MGPVRRPTSSKRGPDSATGSLVIGSSPDWCRACASPIIAEPPPIRPNIDRLVSPDIGGLRLAAWAAEPCGERNWWGQAVLISGSLFSLIERLRESHPDRYVELGSKLIAAAEQPSSPGDY
jgi:hypothetical protein